jgi:transcriptional regulator with XRE-family HTH domain
MPKGCARPFMRTPFLALRFWLLPARRSLAPGSGRTDGASLLALQDIRDAVRQRRYGVVLRRARQARGLTQGQAGRLAGYSGATISRFETGSRRLADIDTLRRLAVALGAAPEVFGLTPGTAEFPGDARAGAVPGEAPLARVVTGLPQDGDDVRRRDMITGTAALAGAAALGRAPGGGTPRHPAAGLEDVLYGKADAAPVPPGTLRAAITVARGDFRDARYDRVPAALPKIIAAAQAIRDNAGAGDRAEASGLLADAYLLAADFAVKVNDDPLSWTTSDRALQAAQASGDPLAIADARRSVATAMRRARHPGRAVDMLLRASRDIEPDGNASPDQLASYGNLLTVAAYTAATAGNRRAAGEYMAEAASAAARLRSSRQPAFGQAGLTLYQVSIAQVLGDNGTAIDHARTIRAADIPTPERQGRYWVDVARAWQQWGKPEACYRALLAAERAAPAEVRYRPPVHRLTEDLLRLDARSSLPGLRDFARRVGVPGH